MAEDPTVAGYGNQDDTVDLLHIPQKCVPEGSPLTSEQAALARSEKHPVTSIEQVCSSSSGDEAQCADTEPTITECYSSQHSHGLSNGDLALLRSWNETVVRPTEVALHDVFKQQALAHPHSEALVSWEGTLSYEEFDRRSTKLAYDLVEHGVGLESLVPVVLEKSIWAFVALLAVLKAGGAFVPIDADYPVQRIRSIVDQSNTNIILTSEKQSTKLMEIPRTLVLVNSRTTEVEESCQKSLKTLPQVPSCATAYVIFTSGSTGIPKGVVIEHSQASTSVSRWCDVIGITEETRSLNFCSFSFDVFILETFGPLFQGGCVCVPSDWSRKNDLATAIEQTQANFVSFTPSVLSALRHESFPSLSTIAVGGELISAEISDLWMRKCKKIVHIYGPTEITIACTVVDTDNDTHYTGYIGQTVFSSLWIVDPSDPEKLVPIGSVGELLVEGPSVGRGYFNNPSATHEAFIEPPSWLSKITSRTTGRFYRTGDLVRYTPTGSLEFFGRKDLQVKLRGHRVELEDIEHKISAFLPSAVPLAVEVKTASGATSGDSLTAFFEIDYSPSEEDGKHPYLAKSASAMARLHELTHGLKTNLSDVLPCYMVPSAFVAVKHFPLTFAGKLDRKMLKQFANEIGTTSNQVKHTVNATPRFAPPSTATEVQLHSLSCRALGHTVEAFGIDDDFFHVGGDSLSAMNLIGSARHRGIHMDFDLLQQNPTVRNLSLAVERLGEEDRLPEVVPFSLLPSPDCKTYLEKEAVQQCLISEDNIEDILPASDLMSWHMYLTRRTPGTWQYSVVWTIPAGIDVPRLQRAWEEMMSSHAIFRTRVFTTDLGTFQVILKRDPVRWNSAKDVESAVAAMREVGFTANKPTQSTLIQPTESAPGSIIWNCHHVLYDGHMFKNMCVELDSRYSNSAYIEPSYPFSALIRYRVQLDRSSIHDYWRSCHAGAVYKPLFSNNHHMQTYTTSVHAAEVPLDLPTGLDIPTNTLVFAAWALVVAAQSDAVDVPLMVIRSGRNVPVPGVENIMGEAVIRAPLRVKLVQRTRTLHSLLADVAAALDESRNHDLWDEAAFKAISAETKAHAENMTMINYIPLPESVDDDCKFTYPVEMDHVPGALGVSFIIGGFMRSKSVTQVMLWDEKLLGVERPMRMFAQFESVMAQLSASGPETRIEDVLVK